MSLLRRIAVGKSRYQREATRLLARQDARLIAAWNRALEAEIEARKRGDRRQRRGGRR